MGAYKSRRRWLAERWVSELGPQPALELARVSREPPPRTIRLSPGVDPESVIAQVRMWRSSAPFGMASRMDMANATFLSASA